MVKPLLPVLFSTTGVAAAGVASYFVFVEPNVPKPVEQPVAAVVSQSEEAATPKTVLDPQSENLEIASLDPEPKPVEEPAAVEEPTPAEEKPATAVESTLPEFTVLRVEPDGNAVIAGSGPADSEIELFDGEISIAKTTSGSTGDFAFVLERQLAPGLHQLTLRATGPDGEVLTSAQAGLVNVPLPEKQEELTVLVTEPGEASRVLSKPEPEEVAAIEEPVVEPEPEQEAEKEVAKIELGNIASDVSKVEVKTKNEDVAVSIKNAEVAGVQPSPVPVKPVLIEAAEVEGDKLFIAGTGEPGMSVNLYLDGDLLGSATVSENGAFLFEGTRKLSAGKYDIRADMSNQVSGKVVARAQVKLIHEPQVVVAKVEPDTAEKPKKKKTIPLSALLGGAKKVAKPAVEEKTAEAPQSEETKEVAEAPEPEVEIKQSAQEPEDQIAKEEETEDNVIRTGSSVIIRRGDNLWRVARRNYGAGIRYTTIFDANRDQVRDPHLIFPGQVLKVPEDENTNGEQDQG